jgi:hypothetical protein
MMGTAVGYVRVTSERTNASPVDLPERKPVRFHWLLTLLRGCLRAALWFLIFLAGLWSALALYYSNLPGALRPVAAAVFVVASVFALFFLKPRRKGWLAFSVLFVVVVLYWLLIPPSNDRRWRKDVAVLAHADIKGNLVTIHNIRNFDYRTTTNFDVRYYDKTYDLDKLRSADFLMSFWAPIPFCHTMVSFGFEGGDYLCVSIETRPEEHEAFSPLAACFKQFELIYVAGDERDLIRLRTNIRDETVYLYHLQTTPDGLRRFFLRYCARMNELWARPEWYCTLTRNCTTDIPRRDGRPYGLFPESWKIIINGFVDRFLHRTGSLDQRLPLDELRRLGHINTRGQMAGDTPDFSQRIREGIPELPPLPTMAREKPGVSNTWLVFDPFSATWGIGRILVNLLPLVIGAAVGGPMWVVTTLVLLRSDHGVSKAAAFVAGAITVRLLQFVLFSRIFGKVLNSGGESELGFLSSILMLLAGIVLLITAVKTWFKETDPEAPPSKWMEALGRVSAPVAFGMAVVVMFLGYKQWVFTLSAIAVIDEANLGRIASVIAYLLFVAAVQSLMLAPIIAKAIAPAQSSKIVAATLSRLERNSRAITIGVSLVFAVWFLSRSAAELLGQPGAALTAETW